jgi:hypothetical protein
LLFEENVFHNPKQPQPTTPNNTTTNQPKMEGLQKAIESGYRSIEILRKELKETKKRVERDKIREQIANEKHMINVAKNFIKVHSV